MKKILSLLLVSISLFLITWNTNALEKCGLWTISKDCSVMENKISKVMNNFFKNYCSDSRKTFEDRINWLKAINDTVANLKKKYENKKMFFDALGLIEENINIKIWKIENMMYANALEGFWMNIDDKTRGITKIKVKKENGKYVFHMWGACTPKDCDWWEIKVDAKKFKNKKIQIVWDKGYSVKTQDITMLSTKKLELIDFSTYSDDRKDRTYTYTFKKVQ